MTLPDTTTKLWDYPPSRRRLPLPPTGDVMAALEDAYADLPADMDFIDQAARLGCVLTDRWPDELTASDAMTFAQEFLIAAPR